ncbi:MAG TPA: glycosyltransferase, partial [Actinomycetota bacterium]|nr:glycosyltransferase [Actinomycetota bacterium]
MNDGTPTILYTSADPDTHGGAFRWLVQMTTEIGDRGFGSVLALSRGTGSAGAGTRIPTHLLSLPRPRRGRAPLQYAGDVVQTIRSARALARIIRREGVALVHANEILDVYAGLAARLAGVPCVWHVRADISSWPAPLRRTLPRVAAGLASRVVVVSGSVRQHVFIEQGVPTRKVSVIHDAGPDPRTFHPGVDGASVRAELGVPADGSLVVLVSKLVEPKGHEVLVRAVPRVLGSFPGTRFLIVGGEMEGEHHRRYAERLRRLPAQLGVAEAVTFAGYRDDVPQVMAAADLIAHCSTHPDPFPGVVLQGMALGRPVIATDLGGATEQIEDGLSGVLVPPGDPLALGEAITSLLKDPDRRASLGAAAV